MIRQSYRERGTVCLQAPGEQAIIWLGFRKAVPTFATYPTQDLARTCHSSVGLENGPGLDRPL
jgi:hypothetical protein